MLLVATLFFIAFSSFGVAVAKYYRFSKEAAKFALVGVFASLWGLGSLFFDSGSVQNNNLAIFLFLVPPVFSTYFLVSYLSAGKKNVNSIRNWVSKIVLVLQLIYTLLLTGAFIMRGISGNWLYQELYLIYSIYFIISFILVGILSRKRIKQVEKERSIQHHYVYSIIFFSTVNLVTNIALPISGNFNFVFAGPLSGLVPLWTYLKYIYSYNLLELSKRFIYFFLREFLFASSYVLFLSLMLVFLDTPYRDAVFISSLSIASYQVAFTFFKIVSDHFKVPSFYELYGGDNKNYLQVSNSFHSANTIDALRLVCLKELGRLKIDVKTIHLVGLEVDKELTGAHDPLNHRRVSLNGLAGHIGYIELEDPVIAHDEKSLNSLFLIASTVESRYRLIELEYLETNDFRQGSRNLKNKLKKLSNEVLRRDEFISLASHQLRTPISVALLNNKLLLEGVTGNLNHLQTEMVEDSQKGLIKMETVVRELLDVARIEKGEFSVSATRNNMTSLVSECLDGFKLIAEAKKISIEFNLVGKVWASCDASKISESISVLVDNAVKYSPEGGKIRVEVTDEQNLTLLVHDQGGGVHEDEIPILFTKFGRTHDSQHKQPDGLGLGLYLVKKTVEAHNGEVIFRNNDSGGSTFGFSLPS